MKYNADCRFFKGDIPCVPHKKEKIACKDCKFYERTTGKILVIKLGAAGDVIRTTPLLWRLQKEYPSYLIDWITDFPDLVPRQYVNKVLDINKPDIMFALANEYDLLYSLDKDYNAVALALLVKAKQKYGFILKQGRPSPIDRAAEHKFFTGISDLANIQNQKHYIEEIFDICGFGFHGEKYILELKAPSQNLKLPPLTRPIIGLNTGCGNRWATRLWPEERWVELIGLIQGHKYTPLLLGGPQEDQKNIRLASSTGAHYPGVFTLNDFGHVVNCCDVVVTQVTMVMHIALALEKKIVLMNNAFNKKEFHLYGLGDIVEPPKECLGCYKNGCQEECMSLIQASEVMEKVVSLV